MAFDIDAAFGIHARALTLREERAGILAQNLANADTPGYKARDIDFRTALAEASGAGPRAEPLRTTRSGHLAGTAPAGGASDVVYRTASQPSVDGNTVESHVENAAYADNALRYQASLTFLDSKIRSIRKALQSP